MRPGCGGQPWPRHAQTSLRSDALCQILEKLEQELEDIRREVRNLTVMGMDPNQSPDQLELIRNLEISARAEMRLRTMALEHAKSELRD